MEKPELTIKPNILNALLLVFLKYLLKLGLISFILFLLLLLIRTIGFFQIPVSTLIVWFVGLVLLFTLLLLSYRIFILSFTTYYFYRTHLTSEFKFLVKKKFSVSYTQITNVTTDVSVWDRICNAGDIIVHTAENQSSDLTLYYIKDPDKIEHLLYKHAHPSHTKKT